MKGYIGVWIDGEASQIINFYVDDEFQNQGFGSMMLEFVIELCKMSNLNVLSLEVRESNQAARKLYTSFGFDEDGIRRNFYELPKENAILMHKFI